MEIQFQIESTIDKPIEEVYQAIVDPDILASYFVRQASAPMASNTEVVWSWSEDFQNTIKVKEVVENEKIAFTWPTMDLGYETFVIIELKDGGDGSTDVLLTEWGWQTNQEGLAASYMHCQGWQHMLDCMKARLVFGVDLRS